MTRFNVALLVVATALVNCRTDPVDDPDGGDESGGSKDGGVADSGGFGMGGPHTDVACEPFIDMTCPAGSICDLVQSCTTPEYTVGTETVTDDVTGLMWQRTVPTNQCPSDPDGVCTWADAQSYCDNLRLGGSSDWRLPTLPELFSLLDMGRLPAIDGSAFPDTAIGSPFWSVTPYVDPNMTDQLQAWALYFDDGNTTSASETGGANGVRCVR
jgi:hypothetical protein